MVEIDTSTAISLTSLILSLVLFLAEHFKVISDLKERLSRLETKMDLFWKAVEKHVIDLLKSPHTKRIDELLNKFERKTITEIESRELRAALQEELHVCTGQDHCDHSKALAIILLLGRLELQIHAE